MSTSSCSLCFSGFGLWVLPVAGSGWEWRGWRQTCRVQHRPDRESPCIWAGEIWFPLGGFSGMQMEKWQPGHTTHPTKATTVC